MQFKAFLSTLTAIWLASSACAVETVTFRQVLPSVLREGAPVEGPELSLSGQALHRDSQGGMIFEGDDGSLYVIPADQVIESNSDEEPFEPLTHDGLSERLLAELPTGFRTHETEHYVVAYDTSREYAEWTSSLLERLYDALTRYWTKQGLDITEPRFPLPIVIHRSATAYQVQSRREGVGAGAVGYYHLRTNRVRMFDLTGSDELSGLGAGARRGSRREITRMLSTPAAEPLVATIVHEATHQVAFNTGVMHRLAKLPLWLVEGMAVYFEAPDAGANRGWRGIGKVNRRRLETFRRNLPNWNSATLRNLVATDLPLRDSRTAGAAYADAWALNYFLIKRKGDEYVTYVKELAEKDPIQQMFISPKPPKAEAQERLEAFEKHFGEISDVQKDLLKMMSRLK